MVIDYLHVMRVAGSPDEADPELIIHANAVLAASIAAQRLKPVPRKDRQIPEFMRRIQLSEPPLGYASDTLEAARRPPGEEALRFLGLERPDHKTTRYNVMRYMSSGMGRRLTSRRRRRSACA